ncbi:invasin domain 3-containing protein [Paenibacillus puldeungensis]|uniref:Invasin domain 3-containing protein n=1 Tax=Paenibacillus puldeungensis TaxID=696536 RepID=A0ABW3RWR0_9BACL
MEIELGMKVLKIDKKWIAALLIFVIAFGLPVGGVSAEETAVLDQDQPAKYGNVWTNKTRPHYQTFTPSITGKLNGIELNLSDTYGSPGAIKVSIYRESDQSTPLATGSSGTGYQSGWVMVDFTENGPYLKKNTMYRMVVSTEHGDDLTGFGWYMSSSDVYPRGSSSGFGRDFSFRTYMVPDHSLSMDESELSSDASSLTADGTSQAVITVKLKDAQGNALTSGGEKVAISSTLGKVSDVTDQGNGSYTATLTAPKTTGTATIGASVGGTPLSSTLSVQFVPGAVSLTNSTVELDKATLIADGTSQAVITVKLKDAQGNALTSGGEKVTIASTLGAVSEVTDHRDGSYTATLTAPKMIGTATISAGVGGSSLSSTASVQFVPGAVSLTNSTVTVDKATLTADGTSQAVITVKLKDAQGNALTSGGEKVTITSTLGAVSEVADHVDGSYTATLTAPKTAGTATIGASVGGTPLSSTVSVKFVPGAVSLTNSTVAVDKSTLVADGTSQAMITVKLKDAQGNALTSGGEKVAISSTLGKVSDVTDQGNGSYTATLTAPTTLGSAKITASVDGSPLESTVNVQLLPGTVSSSKSTITASDMVVRADGISKASISVILKDGYDHTLAGKRVMLQASEGSSVIDNVYGTTAENGLAVFSVSNVAAENITYSATEEASGTTLDQKVTLTFSYNQPPSIELLADPAGPTFESVNVTATASVYGQFNSIAKMKWAAGNRSVLDFDLEGTEFTDHFTVQENGVYSVYVADMAGNKNVRSIDIQNIVPMSGDASLSNWQLTGSGGTAKIPFKPAVTEYSITVEHAVKALKMLLDTSDAYAVISVNGVPVVKGKQTEEYALAVGQNKFEVVVKAQNGNLKTYKLTVLRANASSNPGSNIPSQGGTSSSYSGSDTAVVNHADTPKIQINNMKISGVATYTVNDHGGKSIRILLNKSTLSKVNNTVSGTSATLSISAEDQADQVDLQLAGDAVALLSSKKADVIMRTQHGQYRLPLAEVMDQGTDWTEQDHMTITIRKNNAPGLQAAASKEGLQLVTDPLHFELQVTRQGESKVITKLNRFVEKVIYLPKDFIGTVSTAASWDEKLGLRPAPTKFTQVDGRPAIIIQSLATNQTYFLAFKPPVPFSDIQGHWAAAKIADMSSRMIVKGTDNQQFDPQMVMTRAEFAAMLARALGLPEGETTAPSKDVKASDWYSGAISAVQAYGIMEGLANGTFGPNDKITRQEAIATMIRAQRMIKEASLEANQTEGQADLSTYTDSAQISDWARAAMRTAIYEGLVKGYGNELRPQNLLSRAETTVLLHRMLQQSGLIDG